MFLAVKPSVYTETKAGQDYDVFNPDSKAYDASKVTRAGIGLILVLQMRNLCCKLKNWINSMTQIWYGMKMIR